MSVSPTRARIERLQGRRAGIVSRIAADAVDLVAIFVLYVALLVAFAVVDFLVTTGDFHVPRPSPAFNGVAIVVVQIVYLAIGWSGTTRTVGKELLGLRVVDTRGRPLRLRRGLVRSIVCTFIGQPLLLWAAISKRNAAVYDLFLRTAVIHDWRSPAKVLAAAGLEPAAAVVHSRQPGAPAGQPVAAAAATPPVFTPGTPRPPSP